MPLNNFGRINANLYRSAQPVTDDAWLTMAGLGVNIVYKLNEDGEYQTRMERERISEFLGMGAGLVYDAGISVINPDRGAVIRSAKQVHQLTSEGATVLVHCTHGRDRTGVVIGAYRILYDNWKLEAVLNELEAYGVHGIIALADTGIIQLLRKLRRDKDKGVAL